jgi:hypothetical protein
VQVIFIKNSRIEFFFPILAKKSCLSPFSVAITEYHRLGNNQRPCIWLIILEAGQSKDMGGGSMLHHNMEEGQTSTCDREHKGENF